MKSWEHISFVCIFSIVKMGLIPTLCMTLMRLLILVCLGICRIIQVVKLRACERMEESCGFINESRSQVAYLSVQMPPQGGQMMMASVLNGSTYRKFYVQYFKVFMFLLYNFILCLSIFILFLSMSFTIYSLKLSERWMAIPPTPQKGQKILFILFLFNLSFKYKETAQGITEYQLSSSI